MLKPIVYIDRADKLDPIVLNWCIVGIAIQNGYTEEPKDYFTDEETARAIEYMQAIAPAGHRVGTDDNGHFGVFPT